MLRFGRLTALSLALALLLCAGVGCTPQKDDRPIVAVSILPEAAFVRAVFGDRVRVAVMVPPGYSPESYTPSVAEMADFSDAVLYFSIGVPMESTALLPMLSKETTHISLADAAREAAPDLLLDGGRDPHIWLSLSRVSFMVEAVAEAAGAYDPENAAVYRANADAYIADIQRTDEEARSLLADLACREFLVYHPAFGYFAEEYGLTMYALEQGGKEVTPAELAETVAYAKQKGIKTVFYQAETDSRGAEVLAEEIGGQAVMLSPLAENYLENILIMAEAIASSAPISP